MGGVVGMYRQGGPTGAITAKFLDPLVPQPMGKFQLESIGSENAPSTC